MIGEFVPWWERPPIPDGGIYVQQPDKRWKCMDCGKIADQTHLGHDKHKWYVAERKAQEARHAAILASRQ